MEKDSKFTRDEEGYVAIRTVSAPYSSGTDDKDSMFTRDEDGYVAVRTIGGAGGGGGDQHNLGYYATPSDLQTAHPTAEAGDWAIVGSTDTVWIWDDTTSAWVDSDQKGQVTSVNGQTGAVTLGINDVAPTQTGKSGYVLGTDGFVAGWIKLEQIQRSALPQASEEEVDKIYQYVGATDANYTNGYFYKCVSDGGNPATYSWENIEVQEADSLPSQTGNAGKFLQTDGTDASWQNAAQVSQPSTMPTLAIADWVLDSGTNKYTQTVNVTGVTATNVVYVAPFPANADEYAQCNVIAVSQGAGIIGFQADVLPTNALGVNVVVLS